MKQRLSLPENPFIKDYKLPDNLYSKNDNTYYPIDKIYVTDETRSLFNNLGLEIDGIIVFKKHSGGVSPIHTDIMLDKNRWKIWHAAINYNLTKSKSKMMWFETDLKPAYPTNIHFDQPLDYNLSGIHYGDRSNRNYRSTGFKLIEEDDIQHPTLVRTDVPHTTINLDTSDRICASIRFKNNYSFDQLKEIFREYLL